MSLLETIKDKPQPDFQKMRKVLLRQGIPDRIPFVELYLDVPVMEALLGEKFPDPDDRKHYQEYAQKLVKVWYHLGYDYVSVAVKLPLPTRQNVIEDTAMAGRERKWVDESRGKIENRQDFDRYPWPSPADIDYLLIERVTEVLPEGMKIIGTTGGILEWVMWVMGFAPFALALIEDPDLIQEMFNRVGELTVSVHQNLAGRDAVGALWLGDDMGYKQATMISPQHLRKYVFPWQKKLAEIAHIHNKPFLLHSCGNLEEIMEDLIDYVRIDARHSFEDAITPVTEAKARYGHRIAILGGVDIDVLVRSSEDRLRPYVRHILEECAPGGGYALGSGNSVANYIPVKNYLIMLDEGRKFSL